MKTYFALKKYLALEKYVDHNMTFGKKKKKYIGAPNPWLVMTLLLKFPRSKFSKDSL